MNLTTPLLEPEVRDLLAAGKYRELREAVRDLEPHDVADLLRALAPEDAGVAFRLLPREHATTVFAELAPDDQERLIGQMGDERALRVIDAMSHDDRVALLDELPPEVARRLIAALSPENRRITQRILGYDAESVGRLMTPEYVRVRPEWTVGRALEQIRRYGQDAETVHWVFVIDGRGRLVDDLHIRRILLAEPETPIRELMDDRFVAVSVQDDREEAVNRMADYDRSALPVVDSNGALLGIVTYDDIADVAQAEATEDIQKLAGLEHLTEPYLQTSLGTMLRKRGGWLAGLFIFQVLTIGVMSAFEEQLQRAVILAVFVPLIISAGGNTGTQAASLLVRALALRELEPRLWKRVLGREALTGLMLGAGLGAIGFMVVLTLDLVGVAPHPHAMRIGAVVALSVLAIVVWATSIGSAFPLILERLGLDPATISSPLVATLMDISGIVIYFVVAVAILSGSVL